MSFLEDKLLDFVITGITKWSDRSKDLKDLSNPSWVRRFHDYDDAILYLNSLDKKYKNTTDLTIKGKIKNGYESAKFYFKRDK